MKYYHPDSDLYRKLNVPLPDAQAHGTIDDIRSKLKPLKTSNWRQEGNTLIADTPEGRLVQKIPTDYICIGTDEKNLPIFKKIVL